MSDWTLHLGDCLDPVTGLASLADKSVDHVITDPPYSARVHDKAAVHRWRDRGERDGERRVKKNRTAAEYWTIRDLGFDCLSEEVMNSVSSQFSRVSKRWLMTFCDVESSHLWRGAIEASELEYVRTMAWVKIGGTPQFTGDRPAVGFEAIVLAHHAGKKRWNAGGKAGLYSVPIVLDRGDGEQRVHTTQKPEALMSMLVRDFTDPGDLILDPFAGSGTTGVAALRLGRRFIGWERDPKYHAIATKRLANTREQLEMFRSAK